MINTNIVLVGKSVNMHNFVHYHKTDKTFEAEIVIFINYHATKQM